MLSNKLHLLAILLISHVVSVLLFPRLKPVSTRYYKYCIIGAGPAGLQMAYYLKSRERNYVILERETDVGSFFTRFSDLNFMTSINKRFTGSTNSEYNLRFDWNSLLTVDNSLLFTKYSTRLYPYFREYHTYLQDFSVLSGLNILFSTNIVDISKSLDTISLLDDRRNRFSCAQVLLANGLHGIRHSMNRDEDAHTHDCEQMAAINESEHLTDKSATISYDSDTNFQLASHLSRITASTIMNLKSRTLSFAFNSHYLGDIRSVNLQIVDSYQLKSLDIITTRLSNYKFRSLEKVVNKKGLTFLISLIAKEEIAEEIVECKIGVYDVTLIRNFNVLFHSYSRLDVPSLPTVDASYKLPGHANMVVIGSASHYVDLMISNGGQINGFRHVIRFVNRMMEWTIEGVPWTITTYPLSALIDVMLRRINEAAGLFRMPYVLGDFFVVNAANDSFILIDEFSTFNMDNLERHSGISVAAPLFLVRFEFGHLEVLSGYKFGFSAKRTERSIHTANESELIHPVVYFFRHPLRFLNGVPQPNGVHYQMDDIYLRWNTIEYNHFPLRRFVDLHLKVTEIEDVYRAMSVWD